MTPNGSSGGEERLNKRKRKKHNRGGIQSDDIVDD